jgi:hydroxycarboxylate dehydrogenase B
MRRRRTINPARVDPSHIFDDDVTRYLDWFKQAKPLSGQTILTPGEPERASRAKRLAEGVPLTSETWEAIAAAALSVGLDEARGQRVREG